MEHSIASPRLEAAARRSGGCGRAGRSRVWEPTPRSCYDCYGYGYGCDYYDYYYHHYHYYYNYYYYCYYYYYYYYYYY